VSTKKQTESRGNVAGKRKVTTTKTKVAPQATKVVTRAPIKASKTGLEKKARAVALPKPIARPIEETTPRTLAPARPRPRPATRHAPHVTRVATSSAAAAQHRQVVRMARASQFTFMRAPGIADAFDVGDTVEVFCDHERNSERVRGWIKGIVVQVDNKLVAVQFRSNVFLTDGWMVPDRILWYSLTSDQIRPATFAKRGSQKPIPDY
jgi:hypothetical protein